MSTLKVTNIAGLTGSSTSVIDGLIKAWSKNQQEGGFSVLDTFNASSITDFGTGSQTHNFTNNMGNANYSVSGSVDRRSGVRTPHFSLEHNPAPTTSGCRHEARANSGGGLNDCAHHCVMMIGDLA